MTHAQLLAAGLSNRAIERRVADGRLHRLHRGVYLFGSPVVPPLAAEMAAVLALGGPALLSHRSAAWMWKILQTRPDEIDVMVPGCERKSRAGIRVHRSRPLDGRDYRRRHNMPLTAPPRTLLDLAEIAQPRELERAFGEAMTQRLIRPQQIEELLARSPGRRGAPRLAALLDSNHGPTLTKSDLEEIMLGLIRQAGLPHPEVGAIALGYELDFFWREQRLNAEVDSRRYHGLPRKVESDRVRDADLQARGIRVVRIGEQRLLDDPLWVVARLAQALSA